MMQSVNLSGAFDLDHTLSCGQFFRWWRIGEWYYLVSHGTLVKVRQDGVRLWYACEPPRDRRFIERLFRLDDDLETILRGVNRDALIGEAIKRFKGLRLMRQEPYECLVSYVCSANSSIPNITCKLNKLSELYGEGLEMDGLRFHALPPAELLASCNIDELRRNKIGFHARFLSSAASRICEGRLDLGSLAALPYMDARRALLDNFRGRGVGEKVADCVLLFALEKLEAFPVDVWIERVMLENYFEGRKAGKKDIRDFALRHFGRFAGYAQEYIYYLGRNARSDIPHLAKRGPAIKKQK